MVTLSLRLPTEEVLGRSKEEGIPLPILVIPGAGISGRITALVRRARSSPQYAELSQQVLCVVTFDSHSGVKRTGADLLAYLAEGLHNDAALLVRKLNNGQVPRDFVRLHASLRI